MPEAEISPLFHHCCGSSEWVHLMVHSRPFKSESQLLAWAQKFWMDLEHEEWIKAFESHPAIGEKKIEASGENDLHTQWSRDEQSRVINADHQTLSKLIEKGQVYKKQFGYIYLVCATGKTASEMLGILEDRLQNKPELEIKIAAREQSKITALRLEKLLKA